MCLSEIELMIFASYRLSTGGDGIFQTPSLLKEECCYEALGT